MKDQIIQLLRDFAAQIGTTVDKLWSVLIAQANVAVITNALFLLSVVVATIICIVAYKKAAKVAAFYTAKSKERAEARDKEIGKPGWTGWHLYSPFDCLFCNDEKPYSRNGLAVVWVTSLVYAIGAGIGCAVSGVPALITALFNPEYWALSKILGMIK